MAFGRGANFGRHPGDAVPEERERDRASSPWWGFPNDKDLATATAAPPLRPSDELGIDLALIYERQPELPGPARREGASRRLSGVQPLRQEHPEGLGDPLIGRRHPHVHTRGPSKARLCNGEAA